MGPLQPERPLSCAACASALLFVVVVVAILIGPLTALLAIRAALLLLLLFATLFFVALLLLIGVLVSHFLSPFRHAGGMRDSDQTHHAGRMLRRRQRLSPGRGGRATNVISLRQPMRL